jgi:hypothetical protein
MSRLLLLISTVSMLGLPTRSQQLPVEVIGVDSGDALKFAFAVAGSAGVEAVDAAAAAAAAAVVDTAKLVLTLDVLTGQGIFC